ncbi:MAG TPA: dihydrodipicolinate synthase family protein [Candidatus Latescibacteria bacterium]|nr:dihydrodipicolinate synthase family protein [Candidatus Latescibacterota bacterium]
MKRWTDPVVQPYTGRAIPAYLHGVITPMFTPCNSDGSLDEKGIRAFVDYLIGTGCITTLFARSGLGRMYSFSYEDVKWFADVVLDQAAGRIPVMIGTTGIWGRDFHHRPGNEIFTRQSIELSQYVQKKGAVAAVLVLPMALQPEEGRPLADTIFAYYEAVAREVDLPIILYQQPGLLEEYCMTPPLLERLLTIKNIAGMKYSTGDMVKFSELTMVARNTDFAFIAGDELAFFFAMMLGASGVIGQGCDVNPETLRAVYDRMMARDFAGALEAHYDCIRAGQISEGYDCVISGFRYVAGKGVRVQPFTRGHGVSDYQVQQPVVPDDWMASFSREMDALRRKYPPVNPWA